MKPEEMRALSAEELAGRVDQWEADLFDARCNNKIGQLNSPASVRTLRRRIARAKTIISEKQRHGASQ